MTDGRAEYERIARAAAGTDPADRAAGPPTSEAVEAPQGSVAAALAQAERERDEYLDHLRRERAEFENFRRRMTRQRMDALDRGAEALVRSLLGVVDNFGFVAQAAEASDDQKLGEAVTMAFEELMKVLREAGLEELPGAGAPFDPAWHEAVVQVESDQQSDGPTVVEVLRPGYRFKGRLLRPASVSVGQSQGGRGGGT